jgi:serine protease Do
MFKQLLALGLAGWFSTGAALAKDLPDFTDLVEKQGAAVVNISATKIIHNKQAPTPKPPPGMNENDPFFDFFRRFAPQTPRDQESQSLGSGFIISSNGYILTNAHVIDSADKVMVRLTDKREFKARVIGADKRSDVALLKVEESGLPYVIKGDPNSLKVGEWVVAIGSPFGFDNSVTAGIVSAKGRFLPQENYVPFIQTDVAINPGNSGGPLFNMKGEVVAINSQIYTRSGGFMGLSFSIPINIAMDVADQLRTTGRVTRGRIGVVIQEMTAALAGSFGLGKPEGALISSVEKGGPADAAGIQMGDVILKFNGIDIKSSVDLPRAVAATRPGARVPVQVWRRSSLQSIAVIVGEMPDENRTVQRSDDNGKPGSGKSGAVDIDRLGATLVELTKEQKSDLQINSGVLVEDTRGATARAGLQRGDVILSLNNAEVNSIAQLTGLLKQIPQGRNVALLIRRGNSTSYLAIKLDEK